MADPHPCIDCSQLIQYHEGINKVVNMGSGPGGAIGDSHICPNRVGSKFHHWNQVQTNVIYGRIPEHLKAHMGRMKEIGYCDLSYCKCHDIDSMKDPKVRSEITRKNALMFGKYK